MHANKQCTNLPEFYVAWSWELEQVGKFKEAESTFRTGLEMLDRDDPKYATLEGKHKQFQARVMKKMMEKDDCDGPNGRSEERSALGSLQGHGKHGKVGSIRTGIARKSNQPGTLPMVSSTNSNRGTNGGFTIFEDTDPAPKGTASGSGRKVIDSENLPFRKNQEQENDQNPNKMSRTRIGKKSHAVPLSQISSAPAFSIHVDENVSQPAAPKSHYTTALTSKKAEDDHSVPLAIFEPFDPTKKPMYCKHLVYQGVTEFSFEELRGAKFMAKLKEEEMKAKEEKLSKMMEDIENERLRIAEEQEAWRRKQEAEIQKQKEEMMQWQKEEFQKMMMNHMKNSGSDSRDTSGQKTSSLLESTAALLGTNPLGSDSNSNSLHKTPPRVPNTLLTQPSPTVNTKEAFNLMQDMWGGSSCQKAEPKNSGFKIYEDPAPKPFKIYEDPSPSPAPFKIYEDPSPAPAPFKIYEDPPEQPKRKVKPVAAPFKIYCDENDDAKENTAPKEYQQDEKEKNRRKSGILAESDGVKSIPLEVQEQVLDEDEMEQEEQMGLKSVQQPVPDFSEEKTMAVPSMEMFAEMAGAASTPFHGRRFIPEEDENTCAVQIVFKKPMDPPKEEPQPQEEHQDETQYNVPMSPIMETSREHNYKSSSSSSGESQLQQLTKSHWGNTMEKTSHHATTQGNLFSRTPGISLSSKSFKEVSSGYIADASSARTPGEFLKKSSRPLTQSPSQNVPSKRAKVLMHVSEEDDEDDEPTGLFSGMMGEFKRDAAAVAPSPGVMKSSFLQQSLKASFLGDSKMVALEENEETAPSQMMPRLSEKVFEDSVKDVPGLDMSAMMEGPGLDLTEAEPSPELDETTNKLANVSLCTDVDYRDCPFSDKLHNVLIKNMDFTSRHGYFGIDTNMPNVRINQCVNIGQYEFIVTGCKGEGNYGKVFSAVKQDLVNPNETIANMDVVLKVQKPKNVWEFYICSELHNRLKKKEDHAWFMSIPRCFVYNDGSVFVSEQHSFTLLDVINNLNKLDAKVGECMALYFGIEIMTILQKLHNAHIIHGDIKPDNFLVQKV